MNHNDNNDPLKSFIKKHTSEELSKPVNEFSEILNTIEKPKRPFFLNNWAYSSLAAACLILMTSFYFYQGAIQEPINEEEISFLFESFGDDFYDDDVDDLYGDGFS